MEEDKYAVDSIREKNRKKFQDEEKEESWFDSDDDYSISTNMIIEDLNSFEPKHIEKRKLDEASEGDSSENENNNDHDNHNNNNGALNTNGITDSPRPKRLKYSNSTGSLQL
jgi:hypothetical protein